MDDAAIKQQYDAIVARAGLSIPADREATMVDTYKDILKWSRIVRDRPRPASLEPSNAYFLATVTRVVDGEKGA